MQPRHVPHAIINQYIRQQPVACFNVQRLANLARRLDLIQVANFNLC